MHVAGRVDAGEPGRERADGREDAFALGDAERPAGEKVVLHVDHDERVVGPDLVRHHAATMLSSLSGTKMRLRTCLPSICAVTVGSRIASANASSSAIPGAACRRARTLPFTCTTSVISATASAAGSGSIQRSTCTLHS